MEPYEKWPLILEEKDLEMEIRRDPQSPEEYAIHHLGTENYLFLPRGTLKEIAESTSILHGRRIIEHLVRESHIEREKIIQEKKGITSDTIIALISKVELFEEKMYHEALLDLGQRR